MNAQMAQEFLDLVDGQPADSLIGRFNAAVRLEAEAAESLGNALYAEKIEDFVQNNRNTPIPTKEIREEVLDEIGPLITKGRHDGRLSKTIKRLRSKGHLVGKIMLPVAAYLAFKQLIDGSKRITSRNVGRALADLTPLGIPFLGAEVLGEIYEGLEAEVAPETGGAVIGLNLQTLMTPRNPEDESIYMVSRQGPFIKDFVDEISLP